ncbi:MAG TPA: STN domain-containing protein [Planctomycetaceae bacterium]
MREIARGIERAQRVAIVLDRRLDPTCNRSLQVGGETLLACLQRLAADLDAGAAVIGNVAFLGPRGTVANLRTLVVLRRQELFDKRHEIPDSRRIALTQPIMFRWSDLDQPANLVGRLAAEYKLSVEGVDLIPHDLWASAVLPETTAIEALSLVLVQFDLTFAWIDHGRGVRIEPVPERVVIVKPYDSPRGTPPATALNHWKEEIPDLEARVEHGKIVVTGSEDQHEVVDRVRRGGRANDKAASQAGPKPKPLANERFNGKIQNVPASAVLKDLERPERGQLTFEYDRAEFKAAGIDLEKLVSFELKNAKIEDLLKATLDPLGVSFEIRGRTVMLKPAARKDE